MHRDCAKPQILLGAALALAFVAYALWGLRYFLVDDTYISLKYALNLAQGNGLTWNPGERVEGYTNFLFTVLLAGLGSIGVPWETAPRILTFAAYSGLIYWIWRMTKIPLAAAMIATALPVLAWVMGGLEAVPFALLVAAGSGLVVRHLEGGELRGLRVGVIFALATMTRPEGALFFGLSGGFLFVRYAMARRWFAPQLVMMALGYLALLLPYLAWKFWYYGDLLPNTFYAKRYGVDIGMLLPQSLHYVAQHLYHAPFFLGFAILSAGLCLWRRQRVVPVIYLSLLIGAYMVYLIFVGGDYMRHQRLLVPIIPLEVLLISYILYQREIAALVMIALLLQVPRILPGVADDPIMRGPMLVELLPKLVKPGETVALNMIGYVPFYLPQYHYIDMLGLTNPVIARTRPSGNHARYLTGHIKGNADLVLAEKPKLIQTGLFGEVHLESDRQLRDHPDLQKHYERIDLWVKLPPEVMDMATQQEMIFPILDGYTYLSFYRRKD